MVRNVCHSALILLLLAVAPGCDESDDAVFQEPTNGEEKPRSEVGKTSSTGTDGEAGCTANNCDAKAPTPAAAVKYAVTMYGHESGFELATGTADLVIMSDFSLKFNEASLTVMSFKVDMAETLTYLSTDKISKGDTDSFSTDGRFLRTTKVGDAVFAPARPLVPGPVIQDSSQYAGYTENKNYTVTVGGKSSTGSLKLSVLGIDQSLTQGKLSFTRVLHWRIDTSGFDGLTGRSKMLLMDRAEYYWNVRPVMVPRMVFVARVSDLAGTMQNSAGAGQPVDLSSLDELLGSIRIDMVAKEYQSY